MNIQELKKAAAQAALSYLKHHDGGVIGVGTGSTVNYFISELAKIKHQIDAVVASSVVTTQLLKASNIPIVDLNVVGTVAIYVDGADEVTMTREMIKGGGGALTREKILAAAATQFVCIVDDSKKVARLGGFPVAVEVIPMARSYVARELVKLGGNPVYREGFITDNGNIILDVHQLMILQPLQLEQSINNITGVVCNGIFACRPADVILMASTAGVISW